MIKVKQVLLVNMVILLAVLLVVPIVVIYPKLQVAPSKSVPVFMEEELVVQKGLEGIRGKQKAMKTAFAKATAVKAVKASKVASTPMPQPKVATPLPIFPPKISYSVLPEYPVSALEQGLEGTVVLSILIGSSGNPERIEVKSSTGVSELDESAVTAVSQWKFEPASQGGKAMSSWFEVPIRFVLN